MQTNSTEVGAFRAPVASFVARESVVLLLGLLLGSLVEVCGGESTHPPAKSDRGYAYIHDEVRDVPWSIHLIKLELSHTNLELHTTLGDGSVLGMSLVSEQVKRLPPALGRPVAAINGDFYNSSLNYPGDPQGLQIVQGELVSAPSAAWVCCWIDAAGRPHRTNVVSQFKVTWPDGATAPLGLNEERASDAAVLYTAAIGNSTRASGGRELVLERPTNSVWLPLRIGQTYTARVREVRETGNSPVGRDVMVLSLGPGLAARVPKVGAGAVLKIPTATTPNLTGARTAIGGGPTLVRCGKALPLSDSLGRHPRSAIGWNKDHFFMVVVDGRQRELSVGMTLSELAAYLVKRGCEEAINFDGGGSATIWVMGNVLNSPSQGAERPAANALVLVDKSKPQK